MESVDEQVAVLNNQLSSNNVNNVMHALLMDVATKAKTRDKRSDEDMYEIFTEQELLWHRIVDAVRPKDILTPDLFREAVLLTLPSAYPGWMAHITRGNGND